MNTEPIKQLKIKNFKAFKSFKLSEVKQINLIGGMNNAGKSSLLEAIFVLCSGGTYLHTLATTRTTTIDGIIPPAETQPRLAMAESSDGSSAWLTSMWSGFPSFGEKQNECIEIADQGTEVTLQRGYLKDESRPDSFFSLGAGVSALAIGKEAYHIVSKTKGSSEHMELSVLCAGTRQPVVLGLSNEMRSAGMYRPSLKGTNNLALRWDSVDMTPAQGKVMELLRSIDPKLDQLSFPQDMKGKRNPYYTRKGDNKRYPLALMGDGVNYVLEIALTLCTLAPHGVLLLDEAENGLHYSVQERLWTTILGYAKEKSIQVFATTHSNDMLYALARAAGAEGMEEDCQFIRLEETDSGITPYTASVNAMLCSKETDVELR